MVHALLVHFISNFHFLNICKSIHCLCFFFLTEHLINIILLNITLKISILFNEQTWMHKTSIRHFANLLPFVADYVVTFDWVQRDIIESSENVNLLRFEDGYSRVSASGLIHACNVCPLLISFFIFLDRIHVHCSIKTSNCVYSIS